MRWYFRWIDDSVAVILETIFSIASIIIIMGQVIISFGYWSLNMQEFRVIILGIIFGFISYLLFLKSKYI